MTVLAITILILAGAVTPGQAAQPDTTSASAAIDYIESHQNADGGFPAFGTDSAPGSTVDAVFAIKAAGGDPSSVENAGNSPIDYLGTVAAGAAGDPGAAAKLTLGLAVSDVDPSNFAALNLFDTMNSFYDSGTGVYGEDLFDEALFILALSAAGHHVPEGAISKLESVQLPDGSWEFGSGFGGDTNTTALAMEALIGAGVPPSDSSIRDALDYLATAQNADAGFGFAPGSDSEPSSMAFVIQALVAAGEDIDTGGAWAPSGVSPLDTLISQQNPLTGAFQYFGDDSLFSTYQAIPGVMLAPFPDLETTPDGVTTPSPTVAPTTPASTTPAPTTPAPTATPTTSPSAAPTTPPSTPTSSPVKTPAQLPATGGDPAGSSQLPVTAMLIVAMATGAMAAGCAGVTLRRRR